jgi:hypothetical protein
MHQLILRTIVTMLVGAAPAFAVPVGPAFTYQGRLGDGGNPANGPHDFRFVLYDAAVGGAQVGPIVTVDDVAVSGGLFTVSLDFGAGAFGSDARWLEIAARPGASTGAYTTLSGRQGLTPAPFAVRAEAAPWTGVSGKPAGFADNVDNDSGGTVTSVATGPGLTGGPVTAAGTVSVATGGIVSGMVANGAIGLNQINPAQVQARISGVCPLGSYLRGINPDGSVVCAVLASPHATTTVENYAGNQGLYTSIAIPADGQALVSHFDEATGSLRLLRCGNASCTAGGAGLYVDSAGANVVGKHSSIAIGTDGFAVISYFDDTAKTLKVAKCTNAGCTAPTITVVDDPPANQVGAGTSIAVPADGRPVIAYHDATAGALKVARCANAACTGVATITTVDDVNVTGVSPAIAIGTDGLPVISYVDAVASTLKVARCNALACNTGAVVTIVDSNAGQSGTDIAVPADGLPVISYHDAGFPYRLKVAKCGTPSCNSGNQATVVDTATGQGTWSSIGLGADGLPVVSYSRTTPIYALLVAKCGNAACSAQNVLSAVEGNSEEPRVGLYTSIAISADGLPLISYHDFTNGALKVAKCGSVTCQ